MNRVYPQKLLSKTFHFSVSFFSQSTENDAI